MSLVTKPCATSLNQQLIFKHNPKMTTLKNLGICVRPLKKTMLASERGILKFIYWIEFWRYMGADNVFLYGGQEHDKYRKILKYFAEKEDKFVETMDWTAVSSRVDTRVSDTTAINHCVYKHMMTHRYLLIISFDQVIMIQKKNTILSDVLHDQTVQKLLHIRGGILLKSRKPHFENKYDPIQQSLLLQSDLILAVSPDNFIGLTNPEKWETQDHQKLEHVLAAPLSIFLHKGNVDGEHIRKSIAERASQHNLKILK